MESAASACPACGAPASADARFCSRCGKAFVATEPAAARRVVTALFADVVGSTRLAERMDPEDFRSVVGDAVARMVSAVESMGGGVEHLAGDGLLALFGAPVAHEDDAERAVLAGLRIVADIAEYERRVSSEWSIEGFGVRVGIETGLVVVGPMGAGSSVESSAMGDSVNTAARLQAAARPGTVLVGERTRRMVEPLFDWGERRELSLKGKSELVAACEALRPREAASSRPPPVAEAALIGRGRELHGGLEALGDVLAGAGGVLFLLGEAGIGKSRLLRELHVRFESSRSQGAPPIWLGARCVSYGQALPYLPVRTLLRDWLGLTPDSDAESLSAALAERLSEVFGEEAPNLHEALAPVLGMVPTVAPEGLGPEDRRRRAFDALRTLLERLAADGPVVLAIDDAHWADSSSAQLVQHLIPATDEAALLVVLAARPEREGPAQGLREAAADTVPHRSRELGLEPLGAESDRELLVALVGEATLPADLERTVLERAEGNPLYLEELVRSLLDAGALVQAEGGLRFVHGSEVEVPESVERLVLARIDRLPPDAREVLRAAAVLGRRFSVPALEALLEGAPVELALRELRRHDLVREGRRWPDPEYRFKHTLIQEAAYRSLLKRRRQELHARAAAVLQRLLPDRHGLLALHYASAGDDERALEHHRQAAEAAIAIYATEEAGEQVRGALEAAGRLGRGPEDAQVRRLLRLRGVVGFLRSAGQQLVEDLERALAASRAAGDRPLEMQVLNDLGFFRIGGLQRAVERQRESLRIAEELGDVEARVLSLGRLSIIFTGLLRLDLALDHGEAARRLAEGAGDERSLGKAFDALKLAALALGELDTLEEVGGRAADIHRRQGDPFYLSWALLDSAFAPLGAGRFEAARERLEEALALNAQIDDRGNRPLFLDAMCWLERSRGEYPAALEMGTEAHELARSTGATPEWTAWTAATLGRLLLETGSVDQAVDTLRRGLAAAEQTESAAQLLRTSGLLAAAELARGEPDLAAGLADRAEEALRAITAPPGGAFLYGADAGLAVAEVRLAQERPAQAEALVRPLLGAAERTGWLEVVAQASVLLGRCLHQAGDGRGADELIRRGSAVAAAAGLPGAERDAAAALAARR